MQFLRLVPGTACNRKFQPQGGYCIVSLAISKQLENKTKKINIHFKVLLLFLPVTTPAQKTRI